LTGGGNDGIIKSTADLKKITGKHAASDDYKAVNLHYSEGGAYKSNCVSCTIAYEFRRRGYDVEALAKGGTQNSEWLNGFEGAVFMRPSARATSVAETAKDISDTVRKWGEGSRGIVLVKWSGESRGHAISVENVGGNVYFIDPQVGERIGIETVLKRSKIPETVFFILKIL